MKDKKDICILTENNTYYFINNTDAEILQHAKKSSNQYMFFPIYGKGGIKYYKEDTSVILSPISIKIDATLLLCSMSDAGVNFRNPKPIHLKANTIAEAYSLLGSLYTIEYCCESLETEYMNVTPELVNFDVFIYVDGQEYHLDQAMYEDTVKEMDENSLYDSFVDYGFYSLSVYNLIGYIENTISYKSKAFYSLSEANENYILFPEGDYMVEDDPPEDYLPDLNRGVILISTGSPMYLSVLYKEYDALESDSVYTFSYVVFDKIEIPANEDYIPEEDLDCNVVLELEGYMYENLQDDIIHAYTKSSFIFLLINVLDLSEVLLGCADFWLSEDTSDTNVCYTASMTKELTFDGQHSRIISESITNNIAKESAYDLLSSMAYDAMAMISHILRGDY